MDKDDKPKDFSSKLISFTTPVLFDLPRWNTKFGDCISQPLAFVKKGSTVNATFVSIILKINI